MKQELIAWLGTGSINIFGVPLSGKDTLGHFLANYFDAIFLSSGDLVRAAAKNYPDPAIKQAAMANVHGLLTPTTEFQKLIIPRLKDSSLKGKPLILSSIGRWIGEETPVMAALNDSDHQLKAVIVLETNRQEIISRWHYAQTHPRNGVRADDFGRDRFERRRAEFAAKTLPVIQYFDQLGLTIHINSSGAKEETFRKTIQQLANLAGVTTD